MAFNINDVYTASGSGKVFNSWTPYVSKFDTSTFYNWEQDNLPLYDLEERTYELWEQAGLPTSSVPGFVFTVSGDASDDVIAANPNVFTTLSSCVAAIPKVVRFPIRVEVGSFGDLGKLELHNFRMEENGSIEIINRNYGRCYNTSSDVRARYNTANMTYNKTFNGIQQFSSIDLSNALSDTSCLGVSTALYGADDSRFSQLNAVLQPRHTLKIGMANVAIKHTDFLNSTVANEFLFQPYERTADTSLDDTLATLDISSINNKTGSFSNRSGVSVADNVAGNVYINSLYGISVKNCDGPIFIRNFFVDAETVHDEGINIFNSDVILENCAAVRAKRAGFKFNNSKVVLSRSAASYRNYTLDSTTSRAQGEGVGFHAVNSDVSISALPTDSLTHGDYLASGTDINVMASRNTIGFKFENSKLHGGYKREVATSEITGGSVTSELNTSCGIDLFNSQVDLDGLIDLHSNHVGIKAKNSNMVFEDLTVEYHTAEGLLADNSNFTYDSTVKPTNAGQSARTSILFQFNAQDLVLRNQSHFGFERKTSTPELYGNSRFGYSHGITDWNLNGGNLPTISVEGGSTADILHAVIYPRQIADAYSQVPCYGMAARAVGNSRISFYGSETGATKIIGPPDYNYQQKTAGLYAGNNSQVNLHGPTAILQFGVDVLAEDHSKINIEPARTQDTFALDGSSFDLANKNNHTSVELHSTRACLVANKKSEINLKDLGAWPALWPNTGTGLAELDAGDDMSLIDLGISSLIDHGALQFYPNPQHATGIAANNLDDVSAAMAVGDFNTNFGSFSKNTNLLNFLVTDDPVGGSPTIGTRAKITVGGVCVRATEDSSVNVHNVHFPHGNQSSPLDGAYYDASADLCKRLMIWNLADTSRLNAAYCSVSGHHPFDSSYNGPSALWVSAAGSEYEPASGAPLGTPDTGRLSVLDSFGAGSSVLVIPSGTSYNSVFDRYYSVSAGHVFDAETARNLSEAGVNVSANQTFHYGAPEQTSRNKGVFRLYFSVDPAAKYLAHDTLGYAHGYKPESFVGELGVVPQIFAQCYNMSADVSATLDLGAGVAASSLYPQLVKLTANGDADGVGDLLHTSGFYYCSEFVKDNPGQCMLDESAAATFANAKNASDGTSGKPKKVTLYKSGDSTGDANKGAEAFEHSESIGIRSFNIFNLERDN